jgi:nucleoside-diphosphate-sugar epimerase
MILRDWVRESRNSAVIFRIGNVVGPGCAGLVRFLIRHVLRHPNGDAPARLRGGGLLVRDYVPVDHVINAFLTAARTDWPEETLLTLNLSSGRAMTNREIAEIVQEAANGRGFPLDFTFDDPPGPGEADQVVLDPEDTTKALGLAPPTPSEIKRAIADAVVESFEREASVEKDPA